MVSGYASAIHDRSALSTWRTAEFTAKTLGGVAIERIGMNHPEPEALHDLRYLGDSFRDRERIKRKSHRWRAKAATMDRLERAAIGAAVVAALDRARRAQRVRRLREIDLAQLMNDAIEAASSALPSPETAMLARPAKKTPRIVKGTATTQADVLPLVNAGQEPPLYDGEVAVLD